MSVNGCPPPVHAPFTEASAVTLPQWSDEEEGQQLSFLLLFTFVLSCGKLEAKTFRQKLTQRPQVGARQYTNTRLTDTR